jgi:hypothetical protein
MFSSYAESKQCLDKVGEQPTHSIEALERLKDSLIDSRMSAHYRKQRCAHSDQRAQGMLSRLD